MPFVTVAQTIRSLCLGSTPTAHWICETHAERHSFKVLIVMLRGCHHAETVEQPHAAGTGAASSGSAMLSYDAQGNGLPIPGDQGRDAMPDARRQGQRRA